MEPQALERSALERKDREELATIVAALGGKAPSRARKATLVDMVLELAGVVEGDGEPAAGDDDDDGKAEGSAGESDGGEGRGGDDAAAADDAAQNGAPQGAGDEQPAEKPRSEADGEADDAGGRSRRRNEPRGDDPSSRGGQQSQGADGDDGDAGNRRRRRRGRDRDRGRDDRGDDGQGEPVDVEGLLDLRDDGYGFLRVNGFLPTRDDVYVSVKQVRQFGLRKGDQVTGASRPASRSEKNPALLRIDAVNGRAPEENRDRPRFEDLTPLFPDERLTLELTDEPHNVMPRIIDLVSPIGKGQRGLIVAPPKAGKTTVMKQLARSIETNAPDAHLLVLLIDERPEEVTDFRRSLQRGEVIASTFDRPADEHTHVAELAIERAKRLVEAGTDVVVIVDGITRLTRAYNLSAPASGRLLSGGLDAAAVYPAKRFFGAARNVEEAGSLTILATALVETGSKLDEHVFEEFKGTGNMELKLDRRLAERRIFPAIDVGASSTRHEELLFSRAELSQVWKLRRVLSGLASDGGPGPGIEMLVERLATFATNAEFLKEMAKAPG